MVVIFWFLLLEICLKKVYMSSYINANDTNWEAAGRRQKNEQGRMAKVNYYVTFRNDLQ